MGATTGIILLIVTLRAAMLRKNKNPLGKTTFIILCITTVLSFVGIIFKSYNLVKLYPILMSTGIGSIFLLSLRKGHIPVVEILARLSDKKFPEHAISYTRNVTKLWIVFFVINTLISFYTFFFSNLEQWTLYNGFISYILMGTVMGGEFIVRKMIIQTKKNRVVIKAKSSQSFLNEFIFSAMKGKEIIILPNNQEGTLLEYKDEYDEIISSSMNRELNKQKINSATQITMFTSGSQGLPQKITKDLNCLLEECLELESTFGGIVSNSKIISTVSHQHIYGILFRILWPFMNERKISDNNILYPEQLITDLKSDDELVLVSSPAFLKRIEKEDFKNIETRNLKAIFSSGGKLDYQIAKKVYEIFNIWPIEIFGSTETGGIAFRTQENNNSSWEFFSKVKAQLDERSCLKINSPFIIEESFQTNDKVQFVENGFVLKGRVDRVVKIEEKRISLEELEKRINELEYVKDVHCTIIDGEKRVVIGCVIAESTQWSNASKLNKIKIIKEHLIQYFEPILLPKKFRFLEQLPYNQQSKLSKKKVLGLFDDR